MVYATWYMPHGICHMVYMTHGICHMVYAASQII